jgi:hypothetical protein
MTRVPQTTVTRGSQKWLQIAINERPDILNDSIRANLTLPASEQIYWLSPLADDNYAEYSDQQFLDRLGIQLTERPLSSFWPRRGPQWDGLGKTTSGQLLLLEAKAHIPEMVSPPTAAQGAALARIKECLNEVRTALEANAKTDWTMHFYQYTNRMAFLYLLRQLNHLPAHLIFVCFTNDEDMKGPQTADEWKGAIELLETYLGLSKNHRLSKYVHHAYIDVRQLL